jgi:hypothetical protein
MSQKRLRRFAGFLNARLSQLQLGKVRDPRKRRGRRWHISQLLAATLGGMMAGCKSLADVESMTDCMSHSVRRLLNIPRRIADTTLRDTLCRMGIESLRALLHRAVRAARRRKALKPVGLPFHVAAMDGKAVVLTSWAGPYAQRVSPEKGKPYGLLRSVTTTLATAAGRPCIDVNPIPARTNEMGWFQSALADLLEAYPDLFEVVSYDAGANSQSNARAVVDAKKHYLFHMANHERHMTQMAEGLLAHKNVIATSEDVINNRTVVIRSLRLIAVRDHSTAAHRSCIWSHTRTLLRVDSQTTERLDDGSEQVTHETRFYCSSLAKDALFPAQWLLMVRNHWAVETTHQILDVAFEEDDHPWIVNDPRGALALLVLRRIAYTLLTLYRCVSLRSDENRVMPWKRLMRWFYDTMIAADACALSGLRKTAPIAAFL